MENCTVGFKKSSLKASDNEKKPKQFFSWSSPEVLSPYTSPWVCVGRTSPKPEPYKRPCSFGLHLQLLILAVHQLLPALNCGLWPSLDSWMMLTKRWSITVPGELKDFRRTSGERQEKTCFFRIFRYQKPSKSLYNPTVRFSMKNCTYGRSPRSVAPLGS